MTLVLRANEIANAARQSHEDVAILAAQAGFLKESILDQTTILIRVRRSLQGTYDWGKRDFKKLIRSMDVVDGGLEHTMEMLRDTSVEGVFRPDGEERRSLLDFIDEGGVHGVREAMKKSIQELQVSHHNKAIANHPLTQSRSFSSPLTATYSASTPTFAT